MIWTKQKPTEPGHYWIKMNATDVFQMQPPRVVRVEIVTEELFILQPPDFDPYCSMDEWSDEFWWSSEPVELPSNMLSVDI